MRRFFFVTLFCMLVGCLFGWLHSASHPAILRSTTRLLIEQQTDAKDGSAEIIPFEILQSHLYSDKVLRSAFEQPEMKPFRDHFSGDADTFCKQAISALTMEREVSSVHNGGIVALLHYDSNDGGLALAGVKSFVAAFQDWANSQQDNSRGDVIRLLNVAIADLHPQITELERRYADFRRDAPLAWNSDGEAINPHRERQTFLVKKRNDLYDEMRKVEVKLKQAESLAEQAKTPDIALPIIATLLDLPIDRAMPAETKEPSIGKLWVEAIAQRNRIAKELGEENSEVAELDLHIELFEAELKKIVQSHIDQAFANARKNSESVNAAAQRSTDEAAEMLASMLYAKKAELRLLKKQIEEIDQQISTEKAAAVKLAKVEQDNTAMLRELDRNRKLMNQLEEQLSRISLQTEDDGLKIVELTAPSAAYVSGSRALPTVGIASLAGLGIGCVLSLMLGLLLPRKTTLRD